MLLSKETKVERMIGGRMFSISTGVMAKQAAGAVLVQYGDTVVLSAVSVGAAKPGFDYFPLMVDYREKMYAAGKFPGGFYKRESRPSDKETLCARLTDRPIRPLFPKGYMDEVVINGIALSFDGENDPDILAMTGAAAAVCISEIPFAGPMAGVRVGRINNELIINPTAQQIVTSELNLVMAGTADAVTMVEAGAKELSEDLMIEAIQFGHEAIKEICAIIAEIQEKVGKAKMEFIPPEPGAIFETLKNRAAEPLKTAIQTPTKFGRRDAVKKLRDEIFAELVSPEEGEEPTKDTLAGMWEDVVAEIVRGMLLNEGKRIDGRKTNEVRPIESQVAVLPCTHGSALFTRGETQALVTVTLGIKCDEQTVEGLYDRRGESFYLHYNFPGFCVGEAKFPRGASRREIGHGALAQRALEPAIPHDEAFPYTVRVVSEITESNGSSSMASVCGGTLAMMDAGVPLAHPVAGIAMGLIKEGDQVVVLSDILGDEDHYGDMDFKVTGTQNGITALQMDIKCSGLSTEILKSALQQASEGRIHILQEMLKTIQRPRAEISPRAPRIHTLKIPIDGIGKLIGPGGKTIRAIQDETGAKIDIDDDGTVMVASADGERLQKALSIIEAMFKEPEIGTEYEGVVKTIRDFGAFVEIAPGIDGLVHVSELAHGFVKTATDVVNVGDKCNVKIIDIDQQGRIRLSRKALLPNDEEEKQD